jgi:hypothetical protein
MLTNEIISRFELQTDDSTELSSAEELDLANKIYQQVCSFRPWEFLKTTKTGSIVAGQITLPTDFAYLANNYQSTDSSVATESETAPKVVFVGTNLDAYRVVNFSDRRQYVNQNVCYIDPSDSKIKFIVTPTATTYEFDYIKVPADLTLSTSPIFPARFHDIIAYGMASDDYVIQQSDLSKGLMQANMKKYQDVLNDMSYANAMSTFN